MEFLYKIGAKNRERLQVHQKKVTQQGRSGLSRWFPRQKGLILNETQLYRVTLWGSREARLFFINRVNKKFAQALNYDLNCTFSLINNFVIQ